MDSAGRHHIHTWLSQVDKLPSDRQPDARSPSAQRAQQANSGSPRAQADGRSQKKRKSMTAFNQMYSSRFFSLEPPSNNPNPDNERPITGQSGAFERRPRHRTKPDRYEYKDQKSRDEEKKSKRREKKSSKLQRKHSMNHNFHASNVPQNRLTLSASLNMGIFQKGKTSSPVKSRELRDLAFSEMKFLSRKCSMMPKELAANVQIQNEKKQKDKPAKRAAEYSSRFERQSTAGLASVSIVRDADNERLSRPATYYSARRNQDMHAVGRSQHGRLPHAPDHGLDYQQEKLKSRSTTPFTWSESRCSEVDPYEICLGKLLPFDLNDRSPNNPNASLSMDQDCWDLEGLKSLLQHRKRQWASLHDPPIGDRVNSESRSLKRRRYSSHGRRESTPGRPHLNQHPTGVDTHGLEAHQGITNKWISQGRESIAPVERPDGIGVLNADAMYHPKIEPLRRSTSINPMQINESFKPPTDMYQQDNARLMPPSAVSPSRHLNDARMFPLSQPSLHLDLIELEQLQSGLGSATRSNGALHPCCAEEVMPQCYKNDVSFMERLDAAYRRIFEAEDQSLGNTDGVTTPAEEGIRVPLLDPSTARFNAGVPPNGIGISREPQSGSRRRYVGGAMPQSDHGESSGEIHLGGRHRRNPLSFIAPQETTTPGPESQLISVDILPGFWRQNKLY